LVILWLQNDIDRVFPLTRNGAGDALRDPMMLWPSSNVHSLKPNRTHESLP